jgi:hypothetical protein
MRMVLLAIYLCLALIPAFIQPADAMQPCALVACVHPQSCARSPDRWPSRRASYRRRMDWSEASEALQATAALS